MTESGPIYFFCVLRGLISQLQEPREGKLFSNNGFKKQSWRRRLISSGSYRQADRREGRGVGWAMAMGWAPWLGNGA